MPRAGLDLGLVEAARAGDRSAIDRLLALAQPDIRRYARASCRRADDVDDAVQETLWLLARRVGHLRALTSLSAWLFTVVRRECLRLAVRAGAMPATPLDDDDPALAARLAVLPEHELRLDLAAAIQSLPPHYRDVVILRDVQEMTVDEIAAALSLTREGVKGRLHRARGLLREYLR
jgi:RNA polymerase sigma-70 factor (ECF subfamily)